MMMIYRMMILILSGCRACRVGSYYYSTSYDP